MYFNNCTDLVVERNDLYMGVTSPDNALFSPNGIRYGNLTGCIIMGNRIINRTTAPNPSYERKGGSTQTNCIISRNL